MNTIDPRLLAQLREEAESSRTPSERGDLIRRWAGSLGRSRSTIARWIAESGVEPTRRSAGGRRRGHDLSDDEMERIVMQIHQTVRKNGKKILSVGNAIRLAEQSGMIVPGAISEAQARYWMAKRGLQVSDILSPAPTAMLYSKHPNHVHQFDWSVCLYWDFPKASKRLEFLNWRIVSDKNKIMEEARRREFTIWRGLLVDHFSGAFHLRYYLMKGESAFATIRFLEDAWLPHSNPSLLLHGLPKILIADQGPGNKSILMENLCRNFDVELRLHTPGKPNAKGSVETHHNIVEQNFEALLTRNPPWNIEDLNARADQFTAEFCGSRMLTRARMAVDTRYNLWSGISAAELRAPASRANFEAAAQRPAGDVRIDHQGRFRAAPESGGGAIWFRAPVELQGIFGKKGRLIINPFYWERHRTVLISGDGATWFHAAEVGMRAGGFPADARPIEHPRRNLVNGAEEFRRRADATVLPVTSVELMTPAERERFAARYATPEAAPVTFDASSSRALIDPEEARRMIREEIPTLSFELRQQMFAEINKPISQSDVEAATERYRELASRRIAANAAG